VAGAIERDWYVLCLGMKRTSQGEEVQEFAGIGGFGGRRALEILNLRPCIEEPVMRVAADRSFEHGYAHEELEGLDEAFRCQIAIADGKTVRLEIDDVVVAVDDVGTDNAGHRFAQEACDVCSRELSCIEIGDIFFWTQQAGRPIPE